jgi:ribosomal protein S18 acetylase RimI-like enzyme
MTDGSTEGTENTEIIMTVMAPVALRESQVDEAADALARGFVHDPLLVYVLPDVDDRVRRLPTHFGAIIRYGVMYGDVFTTAGRASGAAVWFRPGDVAMDERRMEASGRARIPDILGANAFARLMDVGAPLAALRAADAPEAHWYLPLLGVDEELQGRGIGSALIQPILDRADHDALPCYVETPQPRNVPFYERHGFRVLREIKHRASGITLWTFRREPMGAG